MQGRFTRFYPVLLAAAVSIAVATGTRLLLALRPDLGAVGGPTDWARVFGYGLAFDLLAAVYVLAPAVHVAPPRPERLLNVVLVSRTWTAWRARACGSRPSTRPATARCGGWRP